MECFLVMTRSKILADMDGTRQMTNVPQSIFKMELKIGGCQKHQKYSGPRQDWD